jgi:hypothetical protein
MNKLLFSFFALAVCLISLPAYSQNKEDTTAILGLPGDNLDLYSVLDLFQKSKTIESFEKSLNDEKTKINNLDLNLDKKVDFIKVVTKKNGDSYQFILQDDVTKDETQDVAVILLDKDKSGKVSLQIVGDEELYGKDYVIEPKGNSSVTANPGYVGSDPVTKDIPASSTVVVQSAPIVQYVYSPVYVPYAPPYHYGYYPPWFGFATVMAVGIYRHNHYAHGGYYGGHYGGGNTVIINNRNNINNYNSNRNRSTTVSNNMARGDYGNRPTNRAGGGAGGSPRASTRPSATTSDRSRSNSPSASNRSGSVGDGGRSGGGGGHSMGGGGRSMGGGGRPTGGGGRGGGGRRR